MTADDRHTFSALIKDVIEANVSVVTHGNALEQDPSKLAGERKEFLTKMAIAVDAMQYLGSWVESKT